MVDVEIPVEAFKVRQDGNLVYVLGADGTNLWSAAVQSVHLPIEERVKIAEALTVALSDESERILRAARVLDFATTRIMGMTVRLRPDRKKTPCSM